MPANKKVTSNKRQVTKKVAKTVKVGAAAAVKPAVKVPAKLSSLSVPVFSLLGKESGSMALPKTVFGAEINKALLNQALRVYLNNQKGHFSNTKTRGEVEGSTRKIYKQKGTGRARHGGIRAPIFVGGGIAFGPKSRKTTLELPKKMKQASLISALSQKLLDKQIYGLSGLEKATGKTSELAKLFQAFKKKSMLVVSDNTTESTKRAVRNIKGMNLISAGEINTFEVIKTQSLIFTKGAVEALEARILNLESGKKEIKK